MQLIWFLLFQVILKLFSSTINLVLSYSIMLFICLAPEQTLFLQAEVATKKDALEMLDFFLEFISSKTSNFLFWFNLFKDKYLMTFYPKVFQELRLLDKYDGSTFFTSF